MKARTRALLRRLVSIPLDKLDLTIARKASVPTWQVRLAHARDLGLQVRQAIDCGAYLGHWTQTAAQIFPDAAFLVVEPNPTVIARTRANVASVRAGAHVVEAAVGTADGTSTLNVWDNEETSVEGSSLLAHVQGNAGTTAEVRVRTLENIADEFNWKPELVKLDLQGGETAALSGAGRLLDTVEMFIVEFSCLDAYVGRTTPRDLLEVMYDHGYGLYDIVDFLYRPYDGTMAGGDFFFVKRNSPLCKHKGWA